MQHLCCEQQLQRTSHCLWRAIAGRGQSADVKTCWRYHPQQEYTSCKAVELTYQTVGQSQRNGMGGKMPQAHT